MEIKIPRITFATDASLVVNFLSAHQSQHMRKSAKNKLAAGFWTEEPSLLSAFQSKCVATSDKAVKKLSPSLDF